METTSSPNFIKIGPPIAHPRGVIDLIKDLIKY